MTANALLQYLSDAVYILVFLATVDRARRRPDRAAIDTMLLFGAVAAIISETLVLAALGIQPTQGTQVVVSSLIMAMPYLLLRLVADFTGVPSWLMRLAEAGLALSVLAFLWFPMKALPLPVTLACVAYFGVLEVYAAMVFVREARRAKGVTKRRMQSVAAGSAFLGLFIVAAGLNAGLPAFEVEWTVVSRLAGLASGIAYFLGFATPGVLRRAWQEPELRGFLSRAATLPRLPDTASILRELERGAAMSTGATGAAIALWDSKTDRLYSPLVPNSATAPDTYVNGRAFREQRAILIEDAARTDPTHAEIYRRRGAHTIVVAPISAGEQRIGVLSVYASRAPIFADDDVMLVQLLADQAAVILESRALIDEVASVRGREEAARMKDDFLSAAAHDLKTPLTTLLMQAELLQRRATKTPAAPADLTGIERMVKTTVRLQRLVLELLDAARAEQGKLVGAREPADLVDLVKEASASWPVETHRVELEATGPVRGSFDAVRVVQLVTNLLDNAVKYSPEGGEVRMKVWHEGTTAHLTVTDEGIGIPAADLPRVFDRFHRGSNVDDRKFSGMGLGLFICRGIAEQHGGRIRAESEPGRGTTFHVQLPAGGADP